MDFSLPFERDLEKGKGKEKKEREIERELWVWKGKKAVAWTIQDKDYAQDSVGINVAFPSFPIV